MLWITFARVVAVIVNMIDFTCMNKPVWVKDYYCVPVKYMYVIGRSVI